MSGSTYAGQGYGGLYGLPISVGTVVVPPVEPPSVPRLFNLATTVRTRTGMASTVRPVPHVRVR